MKFDVVNLYYPNEWRKNMFTTSSSECDTSGFSWFLCSYRALDPEFNLYYLSISPNAQFFDQTSGKSFLARGLSKRGEGIETETVRSRLVILSDPHNKKVLCSRYSCPEGSYLKCDSERSILSTECELVTDSEHLKKIAKKVVKDMGFDGVAIRHECTNSSLDRYDMPVCQEATFVFRDGILEDLGDNWPSRCGIVKYAKKNNSHIRSIIPDFPTSAEIDNTLANYSCHVVSKILYDYIVECMEKEK